MDYRVALIIDSENVSYKYIDDIVNEIAKYGKLVIARFYGDINAISKEWRDKAMEYAIKPVNIMLLSVRMHPDIEMLKSNFKIKPFFIVTSDSDFTPLN